MQQDPEVPLREENFTVLSTTTDRIYAGTADPFGLPSVVAPLNLASDTESADEESPLNPNSGEIENWGELEKIWLSVIIDHLKIDTTKGENPILLAIPSWWNRLDREKITQIFFERFYVPGLYLADTALMTLYGFGQHLTGIVINLYEDRFVVTPVLDTAVQKNAVMNVPIGFREVRKYLRKLLKEDTYLKESLAGDDIDENLLKYIEENVCEVSQVPLEQELAKGLKERQIAKSEFSFNGKTLAIGSAKYRALEAYFNPKLIDQQDFRSLTHAVNDSVSLCDVDRRALLFENVVINGSMGELKGLNERFEKEMSRYIPLSDFASENQPRNIKFGRFPRFLQKLKDKPEYASWLGGSIVAKLVFPDSKNYISRKDYNEDGPSVIHSKSY